MSKANISIENLSPCLTDCLVFFMHLPLIPLTTMIETFSSYRFQYLVITSSSRPFLDITWKHQVDTMLQNAAIRSVSSIPHQSRLIPAVCMTSRAIATPWDIRLSPSVTSWKGETVLHMVLRILKASMPVNILKSTFKSDSFRQSEMSRLFAFLPGLFPNTIREVYWLSDGLVPEKTLVISSVSESPIRYQNFW